MVPTESITREKQIDSFQGGSDLPVTNDETVTQALGEDNPVCLRLPGSLVALCIVGHRCYEGMMEKYESLRNPRKNFSMVWGDGSGEGERDMEGTSLNSRTQSTASL